LSAFWKTHCFFDLFSLAPEFTKDFLNIHNDQPLRSGFVGVRLTLVVQSPSRGPA